MNIEFNEKIIFLNGENGTGKSTIVKMLASVIKPCSGTIFINDNLVNYNNGTYKKEVGFCLNYPTYPAHLKLLEYVKLLNFVYGIDINKNKDYQQNLMNFFELNKFLNYKISELSTGYEKRVKLFASMIHHPKLIVWDEPFANLDKTFRKKLMGKIVELSSQDIYFFITSHIENEIKNELKSIKNYTIKNGVIEQDV
ncbi:ATP-binding cassette domain-containing protein [Polaribacter sp.]|uniref:ATP-binding cassette domain-containing protein n=1 Tax=Polaribacter sp. TaxID=1920175 RepID=UPI0040484629